MAETMSATEQVTELLIGGEALTAAQVAERFNVSPGLLHQAKLKLEKAGYTMASEKNEDGYVCWRVVAAPGKSPKSAAASNGNGSARKAAAAKKRPRKRAARAAAQARALVAPTPIKMALNLGDTLVVCGLLLSPDQEPFALLRDGSGNEYELSLV